MDKNVVSRRGLLAGAAGGAMALSFGEAALGEEKGLQKMVLPTPQQLAWQEAELSMFLHFGINTFTDREWGDGTEDPKIFNPKELDARQWVRTARDAGFKFVILTAKHHDGFCLWQSKFTTHSVKSSPWKGGKGDVVRDFAEACRAYDMKMGLYLSPWDRHERSYGDSPAYNRYYINQLTELLTLYGDVAEVWFDGANGEGPNGKRQEYDWQAFYGTIRRLQPKALIAISGPDIRWVGNEDGFAQETEWSVRDPDPGIHAGKQGKIWWPAECDVSIRPGWFWHKSQDAQVKPLDHLMDIYYRSVGRNSVLLLNVPPNNRGLISEPDVRRLLEFRRAREAALSTDVTRGKAAMASSERRGADAQKTLDDRPDTFWTPEAGATNPSIEIDMGKPQTFSLALSQERIAEGQRVANYVWEAYLAGAWREIARGTTIGYKKIDRFAPITAQRVRFTILRSEGAPVISRLGLFQAPV